MTEESKKKILNSFLQETPSNLNEEEYQLFETIMEIADENNFLKDLANKIDVIFKGVEDKLDLLYEDLEKSVELRNKTQQTYITEELMQIRIKEIKKILEGSDYNANR